MNDVVTPDADDTAVEEDPLVGQVLDGRYRLEHVLGEGGMGLVYLARHVALGRPLAVKLLRADVSRDIGAVERFLREAQAASAIDNEHIIDIVDFGELSDGSAYYAMELLDGLTLTEALDTEAPFSFDRIVRIASQICEAVGAAHAAGIVHRDLKPDNVHLVTHGGNTDFVKVLDFGIAKVDHATSHLTRVGQVFGTPHYMSPEQCAGAAVDLRADVYATGVILYEMITGVVPFDADNLAGVLSKHLFDEPVPPSAYRPDVPADLERVVLCCLRKLPIERYQSMSELDRDLRSCALPSPSVAPEPLVIGSSVAPRDVVKQVDPASAPRSDRAPRRRTVAPLGMLLSAVVLVASFTSFRELGAGIEAFVLEHDDGGPASARAVTMPPSSHAASRMHGATATEAVTIVSTPIGAQVWHGETVLGHTPIDVPRPTDSDAIELEVRFPGRRSERLVVSRSGGPTAQFVALDTAPAPTPARPGDGRAAKSGGRARGARQSEVRRASEVIDPWAERHDRRRQHRGRR